MSNKNVEASWSDALLRYAQLLRPYRRALVWAFLWTLFIQATALVQPSMFALIINQLQSRVTTSRERLAGLAFVGAVALSVIALLKVRQFSRARDVEADIERDLPNQCLHKLLKLSLSYHQSENTGLVIGKVVRGNGKIVDLTWNFLFEFLPMIVMIVITFVVLCWFRVSYAVIVLGGTVVYAYIMIVARRATRAYRDERHTLYESADQLMGEAVTNALTVQTCVQEGRVILEAMVLRDRVRKLVTIEYDQLDISAAARNILMHVIHVGIVLLAAFEVWAGRMHSGDLVFLGMVTERYFNNLAHMGGAYDRFVDCLEPLKRITDLLDEEESIADPVQPHELIGRLTGKIEIRNVSFTHKVRRRLDEAESSNGSGEADPITQEDDALYEEQQKRSGDGSSRRATLQDISLTIQSGEVIGIVGESGSCKSTLANLLLRVYDPDEGSILFDGIDIRDLRVCDLRRSIGYVSQSVEVMNATVAENIRYANPTARAKDVIRAAKIAGAHDFITQKLSDGYKTVVGDRGAWLSGGQQQRIGIARAILNTPPTLIFDEATASVDPISIGKFMDAMEELRGKCTMILISHQLSTIQHADRIIVMENGRIVEFGTHAELLRHNGLYNRLVEMQQRIDAAA